MHRPSVQEQLAASVFARPQSLRDYALDVYQHHETQRQKDLQQQRDSSERVPSAASAIQQRTPPELELEPCDNATESFTGPPLSLLESQMGAELAATSASEDTTGSKHEHITEHISRQVLGALEHVARIPYIVYIEPTTRHLTVTISVTVTLVEGSGELLLDTTFAGWTLSARTIQTILEAIADATITAWDGTWNFVFHVRPFEAVAGPFHQTTELIVHAIQAVATDITAKADSFVVSHFGPKGSDGGMMAVSAESISSSVGSSSFSIPSGSAAMSSATLAAGMDSVLSSSVGELSRCNESQLQFQIQQQHQRAQEQQMLHLQEKQRLKQVRLLRKLSSINSAASMIAYREVEDDTGGLSTHARSRVHRMMHYQVSLRPFVATVKPQLKIKISTPMPSPVTAQYASSSATDDQQHSSSSIGFKFSAEDQSSRAGSGTPVSNNNNMTSSSTASTPLGTGSNSPFMCTPQSFPPTPISRRMILARGTRFADDVLFLARDQLRVLDGLESENDRTREMAEALSQGRRLAVFDAEDGASTGIEWTCGQHVATKVGNVLYCSTRSMVPILRNCYVYFEITVLPRPGSIAKSASGKQPMLPASMATLSIGLSTKEMPPSTLVGAQTGSVGLCTTGQMLTAGQWCSPVDPSQSAYGDRSTVGCLVCLDDASAFETWDGIMVTAAVTFWVNGVIVTPPVSLSANSGAMRPQQDMPPAFNTLPLLVPAEEELYPTVTLHSPASSVMCRFSAEDIVCPSRDYLGVPVGVTVYAVDGSVIFE